MTTHHHEPIVCECGHKGTLDWSENDQPFSKQWESYSLSSFEGKSFYIEGWTTSVDALVRMNPKCPSCSEVGKVSLAKS